MKIRKTKKGNSIRRIVAFLLCMTMVLGLGMQDVMEQVYAEETPVTVQEGTAQDTEKITEGEQTGDEPAAPEETAPPTEETENEGSTGDTSGDGVQDEPDAGQPGEDTNTGESGGDNTGDTGTETQPGDGSTNTSGEEGNVDTPGEGEGQGTEEGDVTVPTVPEGEEGQKPAEGDATVPEGEEGQKPGEGDAAASEDTEQADAPEEEEPAEGVAFEDSYTDEKVTIQVSAEAGVIPEGAVLSVTPIEKTEPDESMSDEEKAEVEKINAQYDLTEKKLTEESDENGEVMEGFLAYDISFVVTSEDGETQSEVEPAGEVKVVMDFNEAAVPEGVSENAEVSIKHLKEDETAEDGIVVEDVTENAVVTAAETGVPAVEKVELVTDEFSAFALYYYMEQQPALLARRDTVETVNTRDKGIKINLFDYQVGQNQGNESAEFNNNTGINEDKVLKFVSGRKYSNDININENHDGKGIINSGMVKPQLEDGFPVLNYDTSQSLDYLFNDWTENGKKAAYTNLNGLFQEDGEGYYYYDSDLNYAYLEKKGDQFSDTFTVLEESGLGFFPFTDETHMNADSGARAVAPLGSSDVNHYFGMNISANFIQPRDGKIDNKEMVFEFSGDDDVWVFIDGVLVLDLGGIHAEVSGTINFADGTVTRWDINQQLVSEEITIKSMFEKAGVSTEDFEGNTFADYTSHSIQFFYLERGNSDSNCKIKFNLSTIPEESVIVTKEVTGADGGTLDFVQNVDFDFIITKGETPVANTTYKIFENGEDTGKTGTTDGTGKFSLKPNQSAVFSGFKENEIYEVREIGVSLDEGYDVSFNNQPNIEIKDETGATVEHLQSASTGDLLVGDTPAVTFKNEVEKTATLSITKKLNASESDSNEKFKIQLWIAGEEYANGHYQIDEEGFEATKAGIITLQSDQTATVSGLPYGIRVEVREVLDGSYLPEYSVSGNVYNVVLPDENGGGVDEDGNPVLGSDGNNLINILTASGNLAGDAEVIVTNHKVPIENGTTNLTVTKTWENGTEDIRPDAIKVTLYQDENHNGEKDTQDTVVKINGADAIVVLNDKNQWTHTWNNLPADMDYVVEETAVNAGELNDFEAVYTLSDTINNIQSVGNLNGCKGKVYNIGQNNMLLMEREGGAGYILWTPIDLKLDEEEVTYIATAIETLNPGIKLSGLKYVFGPSALQGVTVTSIEDGWKLSFSGESSYVQFWDLKYDRTFSAGIHNELKEKTIDIPVKKEWYGDKQFYENFNSVTVQLMRNGKPVENGSVEITRANGWKDTFEDQPYYFYSEEEEKYKAYDYSVKEIMIGNMPVEDVACEVEVVEEPENNFVIKNTYYELWYIRKMGGNNKENLLEGAKFTLKKDGQIAFYGQSDSYGIVTWWKEEVDVGVYEKAERYIPAGTYILEETEPPLGYQKSNIKWTITIDEEDLTVSIVDENGDDVPWDSNLGRAVYFEKWFYYNNEIADYELPSTGGPGIHLYMLGGTLLLMAGSLLVYKKRKKEVLGS